MSGVSGVRWEFVDFDYAITGEVWVTLSVAFRSHPVSFVF
jgi:hypothetical protein